MDTLDSCDDAGLLTRYAREGDQRAFALLIERHVSLVYATARRVLGSTLGADDVAQVVFVELAQAAKKYDPKIPVVAWLCAAARNRALNVVRGETRRLAREQAAHALSMIDANEPNWVQIEPVLDEAMDELPPPERSAVWLRFFEGKGLREVGAELGISEDAAQKRVTRALEQLRELLGKRGVKLTSAGLATGLTAQAATLASAPVGLAAAITAAVGGLKLGVAAAGTGAAGAAQVFVMTTMQKIVLGVIAVIVMGFGVLGWMTMHSTRAEVMALEAESLRLKAQININAAERSASRDALTKTEATIDPSLASGATPSQKNSNLEAEMLAWLARMDRLKNYFNEHPDKAVPEMKNLSDGAWLYVAKKLELSNLEQMRKASEKLRSMAVQSQILALRAMLRDYQKRNSGRSPKSIEDLVSHAGRTIDKEALARYEIFKIATKSTSNPLTIVRLISSAGLSSDHLTQVVQDYLEANLPSTGDRAHHVRLIVERVRWMQDVFRQRPELQIPEMSLLADIDWLSVASFADLSTQAGLRKALGQVRTEAKQLFYSELKDRLSGYVNKTGDGLREQQAALFAYLKPSFDPAILRRLRISVTSDMPQRVTFWLHERFAVDADYDSFYVIGSTGYLLVYEGRNVREIMLVPQEWRSGPASSVDWKTCLLSQGEANETLSLVGAERL